MDEVLVSLSLEIHGYNVRMYHKSIRIFNKVYIHIYIYIYELSTSGTSFQSNPTNLTNIKRIFGFPASSAS